MLRTIEKLLRRAKELDRKVKRSVSYNDYDFGAAEDRDLLEEAIKTLQTPLVFRFPADCALNPDGKYVLNRTKF